MQDLLESVGLAKNIAISTKTPSSQATKSHIGKAEAINTKKWP